LKDTADAAAAADDDDDEDDDTNNNNNNKKGRGWNEVEKLFIMTGTMLDLEYK
jgi:hypothetical protein